MTGIGDVVKGLDFGKSARAGEGQQDHPVLQGKKKGFTECMELVERGVDAEDTRRYQELYQSLSPEQRALVDTHRRMLDKIPIEDDARHAAAAIRETVAPGGKLPPQQMWAPCAPMPTDMCRVSPFFPTARQKIRPREWIEDLLITSNSWGEIKYTGPKLSTYEEDVLLALLALLDSEKNRQTEQQAEGRSTYTYRGPLLPVLRLMGYKTVGKTDYTHVIKALHLMTVAGVTLIIYGRTTRGKRKTRIIDMTNMLSHAKWDEDRKELTVTINPYFYEQYIAGTVTLIDVVERGKLRSPIAKSLMRFLQSHRAEKWGPGHYLTLARTLNLDLEQPPKQIKRLLKGAVDELLNSGCLSAGGFESKDLIGLTRAANSRKLLIK